MLKVTDKAAAILKAAKTAEGASPTAGIRIHQAPLPDGSRQKGIGVAVTIKDEPEMSDEVLEQDGLRVFLESTLIAPLDERTLDVQEAEQGVELVFR
jgi:Fe-S cluster assembly iron-binding protein IscA